jgi:hypothetical protein
MKKARRKGSAKRKPATGIVVAAGDLVLLGGYASMPGDWHLARIVWTDGENILVEHHGLAGNDRQLDVQHIGRVRAVGTIPELRDYKDRCRKETETLWREVREAENALGRARDAVWARLDEMFKHPKPETA